MACGSLEYISYNTRFMHARVSAWAGHDFGRFQVIIGWWILMLNLVVGQPQQPIELESILVGQTGKMASGSYAN